MEETGRISELVSQLREYKNAYYNGDPLVADEVYDALEDDLRKLSPTHPFLSEVGASPTKMKWEKKTHLMPMTSLNKVNSIAGVRQWVSSVSPNPESPTLSWSEKLDGISICLNYEKGELQSAITRGDGTVGEDIMANVVMMRGVLRSLRQPYTGSIRGEIVLTHDMWKTYFPDYANPRNAASGIAKRESRDKAQACQHLTIMCYDAVSERVEFASEAEKFVYLKGLGLKTPNHGFQKDVLDLEALYVEYDSSLREELNYDIDGLVIRIEHQSLFERAGQRGGNPHGAVALKFAAEGSVTTLRDVEWQTGNTGRITPVAIFDPVNLVGAEVRRATLHNQSYIENLGMGIGDDILVVRANDVIPQVKRVVSSHSTSPIEIPSQCPECSNPTEKDGEYLVCTGGTECPANRAGLIKQWIAALGVLDWGDFIIEELVAQGLVNDIPDLYKLDPKDIANLRNSNDAVVGTSTAEKIMQQLKEGSEATLEQLVGGLGISSIRKSSSRKIIAAGYDTPTKLMEVSVSDVESIPGFGNTKAVAFVEGMKERRHVLEELIIHRHVSLKSASGSLEGKTFCLTGSMSRGRKEIKRDIEDQGGIVKGMSQSVTYLVTSNPDSTSGKAKKARDYGIPIISEEQLYDLM